jgi:hypothetical protein
MPVTRSAAPAIIELPPLNIQRARVRLVGDSPLISHAWSAKAKKEMLDKQTKKAKVAKAAKDPERDFWESLYILRGDIGDDTATMQFGFPSVAFKTAAVDACSHIDGVTKVEARGAFHVAGEYVVINGTPTPREDMVRIGMGTADLRYRGEFREWSADIDFRYNANVLSLEQVVNLFNTAGFAIGVGEWRPQRDGSFGMFHVANAEG